MTAMRKPINCSGQENVPRKTEKLSFGYIAFLVSNLFHFEKF